MTASSTDVGVPGWTQDELVAEAVVAPRRAYIALPDLEVVDRPGWLQITTPSFTRGGFNEVMLAAMAPAEADEVIDRTIAAYRAHGIHFRWTVGPDSAPPDLAERLARRGLAPSTSIAMARGTEPLALPAADPTLTVERVHAGNIEAYTQVMAAGWGVDPAPLRLANALMLREHALTHTMTLARLDGVPAGVAGQVLFARSTYLLGAVVLPAFRRRGLYAALVAARIDAARAAGLALATSLARADTSAPLLARMGFTRVLALTSFAG